MGQTLTHGVYLPDEGERNCYNGLAANWSILDGAVGTIAEHTSALAGKAPLVHTHSKSDITDFPVYGTTAGTICEGNDSRLSDARTPVAHTHTKSDVTNLFNSANTWSENNKFNKRADLADITSVDNTTFAFTALNNTIFFNTRGSSNFKSYGTFLFAGYGSESEPGRYGQIQLLRSTDKSGDTGNGYIPDSSFKMWRVAPHYLVMDFMENVRVTNDGTENSLKPIANNVTDLGTSTNQWNNLYAKNYYYNGVAWGLDKANTWTGANYFTQDFVINFSITSDSQSALSGSKIKQIVFNDSDNSNYFFRLRQLVDATSSRVQFNVQGFDSNNQAYGATFVYKTDYDGSTKLYPGDNNQSLGTSTNKWQSLNGINPGALSFPNYSDTTYIDISGSIVPPTGETEINKNLGENQYTPPVDGWLSIRCDGAKYLQIYRNSYNCPGVTSSDGVGSKLVVTLPVRKNVTYTIRIKKDSAGTEYYQLYPCLGNV